MPVKDDNSSFWERTINNLKIPAPETGSDPPTLENIKQNKRRNDGSRKVLVQKVTTYVYVFTDTEGKVYTSHTAQNLQILGMMTLENGLKIAQEDNFS